MGKWCCFLLKKKECHIVDSCVEWVVDCATTYHVTSNKEFFVMYKAGDFSKVKMGNNSVANIVGISDVCVQTNISFTLTPKDVPHVLDLRLNLISVHALNLVGFQINFGDGKWKPNKGSLMVVRSAVYSMLYKNQVKLIKDCSNVIKNVALLDLWHKRLAHLNEKGLQILSRSSLVASHKCTKLNSHDCCLFGKQHRVSFSRTSKLKIIYWIWGILIRVDLWKWRLLVVANIWWHLLTMLIERCRCTSLKSKNKIYLLCYWKNKK